MERGKFTVCVSATMVVGLKVVFFFGFFFFVVVEGVVDIKTVKIGV